MICTHLRSVLFLLIEICRTKYVLVYYVANRQNVCVGTKYASETVYEKSIYNNFQ